MVENTLGQSLRQRSFWKPNQSNLTHQSFLSSPNTSKAPPSSPFIRPLTLPGPLQALGMGNSIQWTDLDHFYGFWQSEWFSNFWNWYQMIIAKTFSGFSFEFRLRVGSSDRRPGQSDDHSRRRLVQRISREDGSHRTFPKNLCHKKRVLKHFTIIRSQIALLEPTFTSSSLW